MLRDILIMYILSDTGAEYTVSATKLVDCLNPDSNDIYITDGCENVPCRLDRHVTHDNCVIYVVLRDSLGSHVYDGFDALASTIGIVKGNLHHCLIIAIVLRP